MPHYQRIPEKFSKDQIKIFENDYFKNSRLKKNKQFLEEFDQTLMNTLVLNRQTRFKAQYKRKNDQTKVSNNNESNLSDYDSDQERNDANLMFIKDYQTIRMGFINMVDHLVGEIDNQDIKFTKERSFFLDSLKKCEIQKE